MENDTVSCGFISYTEIHFVKSTSLNISKEQKNPCLSKNLQAEHKHRLNFRIPMTIWTKSKKWTQISNRKLTLNND